MISPTLLTTQPFKFQKSLARGGFNWILFKNLKTQQLFVISVISLLFVGVVLFKQLGGCP